VETVDYYNEHAEEFYRDTIGLNMEGLYAPFLSLVPKGGRILDAGCGSGRDSVYFMHEGYDVTAFDASSALVSLSARKLGDKVHCLSFHQISFDREFDGVWACASLLHVPRSEMGDAINKLAHALKQDGVLYASFKYGDKEEIIDGRLFSFYDEASFNKLIRGNSHLSLINLWKTEDVRKSRPNEYWLNVLLRRSQ
jgi:SAM-dependent methyltransferase